jgi:hypothetical protein
MMLRNTLNQGESVMSSRAFMLTLFTCCLAVRAANADGLIFQLPQDGTWATFSVQTEGKFRAVAPRPRGN